MDKQFTRQVDFVCPFSPNGAYCTEIMSPIRQTPSNREKKLLVMMNKPLAPTKNACPHCSAFIAAWKNQVRYLGHFRYLWTWLFDKKVRESAPQEQL